MGLLAAPNRRIRPHVIRGHPQCVHEVGAVPENRAPRHIEIVNLELRLVPYDCPVDHGHCELRAVLKCNKLLDRFLRRKMGNFEPVHSVCSPLEHGLVKPQAFPWDTAASNRKRRAAERPFKNIGVLKQRRLGVVNLLAPVGAPLQVLQPPRRENCCRTKHCLDQGCPSAHFVLAKTLKREECQPRKDEGDNVQARPYDGAPGWLGSHKRTTAQLVIAV